MSVSTTQTSPLEALLLKDIASNSTRLILTRWAAGILMLVATFVCVHWLYLPLAEAPLYLLGGIILIYNGVLTWLMQRVATPDNMLYRRRLQGLVVLQIALDWLSMAVFLHLTGGVTSPAVVFFFLHVLMVTILLPGQSPYIYVVLAVGVVVVLAVLEAGNVLAHYAVIPGLPLNLHTNPIFISAEIIFFAVGLFAVVFLTASIMSRLRERDRQVAALFQITQDVSSTLDIDGVLNELVRHTAQALNVPAASVRLLDEGGGGLTITAAYGLSESYLDKGPLDPTYNPLARTVLTGGPVIIPHAAQDSRIQYPQKVIEEGIQSELAVPLMCRNKPLGILRVYAYTPDYFNDEDAEFVLAIARQGGAAIENALAHDALQQAEQQRAQFVRIVTHELRSPVTGSQSLLRVLLRNLAGELSEQQYDIISRLNARMDTLLQLINDLLSLASSKSMDSRQKLEPVGLQSAIEAALERFRAQAEEKHITLTLDISDSMLNVKATEEGIGRILDNLVGNAVKYTPDEGSVCVRLKDDANSAVLTVTDTGIGIPEESLAKIGDEFFRASNAREAGIMGTGLGLATVKQLVENFGGLMRVESTVGEGTTFTVTLPVVVLDGVEKAETV